MGDAAVVMDFGMVTRMRAGPQGEVLLNQDENRFGKLRYARHRHPFGDRLPYEMCGV